MSRNRRNGLKPIHQIFAEAYLECFDVREAALRAGYDRWYDETILARVGRSIMRRKDVASYIEKVLTDQMRGHGAEKGKVLKEMLDVAFADVADMVTEEDVPLPIHEMPRRARRAIAGLEIEDIFEWEGTGEDRRRVHMGYLKKYKLRNQNEILKTLYDHLYPQGKKEESKDRLDEIVAAIQASPAGPPTEAAEPAPVVAVKKKKK